MFSYDTSREFISFQVICITELYYALGLWRIIFAIFVQFQRIGENSICCRFPRVHTFFSRHFAVYSPESICCVLTMPLCSYVYDFFTSCVHFTCSPICCSSIIVSLSEIGKRRSTHYTACRNHKNKVFTWDKYYLKQFFNRFSFDLFKTLRWLPVCVCVCDMVVATKKRRHQNGILKKNQINRKK